MVASKFSTRRSVAAIGTTTVALWAFLVGIAVVTIPHM